MRLNISQAIWQSYINEILDFLQSRKHCEVIMDDLSLFTSDKNSHRARLGDSFKSLLWNGLKICQLFKKEIKHMGHTIFIKGKKVCVTAMRTSIGSFGPNPYLEKQNITICQ